jgi:hypothetical protein
MTASKASKAAGLDQAAKAAYVSEATKALLASKAKAVQAMRGEYEAMTADQLASIVQGKATSGTAVTAAMVNLAGKAAQLAHKGGNPWPVSERLTTADIAKAKPTKGLRNGKAVADDSLYEAWLATYLADDANRGRGGKFSVCKAADAFNATEHGTMWGNRAWGRFQAVFGRLTGDALVEAKGASMAAGLDYGAGRTMAAVLADVGERDAKLAKAAQAALDQAAKAKAEREAKAKAAAAAKAKAAKAAAAKAKREAAKAAKASTAKATPRKASTPRKAKAAA